MRILAEYNKEPVYLISVRSNGYCTIIKTGLGGETATLKTVKADELTIIDKEYIANVPLGISLKSARDEENEKYKALGGKSTEELKKMLYGNTKAEKETIKIKNIEL